MRELIGLEVQETASGWRVDHRVGRHDDHVVAVALAVQRLRHEPAPLQIFVCHVRPYLDPLNVDAPIGNAGWRAADLFLCAPLE